MQTILVTQRSHNFSTSQYKFHILTQRTKLLSQNSSLGKFYLYLWSLHRKKWLFHAQPIVPGSMNSRAESQLNNVTRSIHDQHNYFSIAAIWLNFWSLQVEIFRTAISRRQPKPRPTDKSLHISEYSCLFFTLKYWLNFWSAIRVSRRDASISLCAVPSNEWTIFVEFCRFWVLVFAQTVIIIYVTKFWRFASDWSSALNMVRIRSKNNERRKALKQLHVYLNMMYIAYPMQSSYITCMPCIINQVKLPTYTVPNTGIHFKS